MASTAFLPTMSERTQQVLHESIVPVALHQLSQNGCPSLFAAAAPRMAAVSVTGLSMCDAGIALFRKAFSNSREESGFTVRPGLSVRCGAIDHTISFIAQSCSTPLSGSPIRLATALAEGQSRVVTIASNSPRLYAGTILPRRTAKKHWTWPSARADLIARVPAPRIRSASFSSTSCSGGSSPPSVIAACIRSNCSPKDAERRGRYSPPKTQYATTPGDLAEMLGCAQLWAKRAAALMPGSGRPATILAEISAYRLDFLATLRGFEQAMAAEPNDGFVLWKALNNFPWLGDAVQSLSLAERYIALDPLNPAAYNERGSRLYVLRLYADAIDAFNKALAIAPQRYSHG